MANVNDPNLTLASDPPAHSEYVVVSRLDLDKLFGMLVTAPNLNVSGNPEQGTTAVSEVVELAGLIKRVSSVLSDPNDGRGRLPAVDDEHEMLVLGTSRPNS